MKEKLITLLINFLEEQGIEHNDLTPEELQQIDETAEILVDWSDGIRNRALSAAINALGDVDKNGVQMLKRYTPEAWLK